jgi:hypothetical protein
MKRLESKHNNVVAALEAEDANHRRTQNSPRAKKQV